MGITLVTYWGTYSQIERYLVDIKKAYAKINQEFSVEVGMEELPVEYRVGHDLDYNWIRYIVEIELHEPNKKVRKNK